MADLRYYSKYPLTMLLFATISFIAGILTVLAPCVLPLLPIIIGGSVANGSKKRAYTVIISLIASVVLFTLLIKVSSVFLNVSPDVWKYISGIILGLLGVTMIFPTLWESLPFIGKMSVSSNKLLGDGMQKKNFAGDVLMGAALGPVFSTCSPTYFVILATVLPSNFTLGLVYLLAYSIGLGGALLAISIFGQKLANKLSVTSDSRSTFKRSIGVIFIIVSLLIVSGYDKKFQVWVSAHVFDVTKIEQLLLRSTEEMKIPASEVVATGTSTAATKTVSVLPSLGRYQEITNPAGFVNTNGKAIKISDYIGKKIILVDFMTYSCINCVRTFPYLIDWNTKYKDRGLVTIGIHTPEFAFEKKQENVEKAMRELGITFPVVLDNDYGTWNAYKNQFWPRKFIIDLNGNIVYDHIGEGEYQETEAVIQKLLKTIPGNADLSVTMTKDTSAKDLSIAKSQETYLGYARFGHNSNKNISASCDDVICAYVIPEPVPVNTFAFGGNWNIGEQFAVGTVGSEITYHATGNKVHFVAGAEKSATIAVYVDGVKTKEIIIDHDDLYTLVDTNVVGVRTVNIKVVSGVLDAYTFTF